jgi:protoheme IX farnesyltransferase
VFSIFYLFVLFAALLVDQGGDSFSLMRASHAGRTAGPAHAELRPGALRGASSFINLSMSEV